MENNTNQEENHQVVEDAQTFTEQGGNIYSIAGNVEKAEQFEKANLTLEDLLMADNFAEISEKHGYAAGTLYLTREVKSNLVKNYI